MELSLREFAIRLRRTVSFVNVFKSQNTVVSYAEYSNLLFVGQSRIGILISPAISPVTQEIEIYWNNVNIQPDEKLVLVEENNSGFPSVLYNVTSNGPSGVENTGIRSESTTSSEHSFAKRCSSG